jgi:hypothetical protein
VNLARCTGLPLIDLLDNGERALVRQIVSLHERDVSA